MDDSAVFAVRAKYADDLEELVQCPVCFERPSGPVLMCVKGHHLCERFRGALLECPICKGRFSETRNFAVEELCEKLPDILSSLLEPTRRVDEYQPKSCRIGFCQTQMPDGCAYYHVRGHHLANLVEMDEDDTFSFDECFERRWNLEFDVDKLYDFAVYHEELGLFFLNLHIDREGNMLVDLHVADSHQDDELQYKIDMIAPNDSKHVEYNGKVQPGFAANEKFAKPHHKCDKKAFKYYFRHDGVTRHPLRTLPFEIRLLVEHADD